mgnify:CR=1 FL=1
MAYLLPYLFLMATIQKGKYNTHNLGFDTCAFVECVLCVAQQLIELQFEADVSGAIKLSVCITFRQQFIKFCACCTIWNSPLKVVHQLG